MASMLERIYGSLPVPLQNVMVSVRGWQFRRQRYDRTYHACVDRLMRNQWWTAEQFRDSQIRELRRLIREAAENTVYYRETFSDLLPRLDTLTLEDLAAVPILEKSILRTRPDDCLNRSRLRYGYRINRTSGTTGTPLATPYDFDSVRHNLAFRERQYRWAGITGRELSARFSGRIFIGRNQGLPFWRYNAAERQWLFSSYHETDENLRHYTDALARIQPVYIDGFPSALFALGRWVVRNDRCGEIRPWCVVTTGETLDDHQRETIEQAFGCTAYDFYSSSEGAPFITQCDAGGHHINPESGIVEIVRPDGKHAQPGELGELLVTSFFQRTVPLIRYRIGDSAVAGGSACPCRRQMPLVQFIAGRMHDLLWTRERGYVSRVTGIFGSIPASIREAQIAQTGLNRVEIRYAVDEARYRAEQMEPVVAALRDRMGEQVEIALVKLPEIPRDKNGKYRTVVREVDLPPGV